MTLICGPLAAVALVIAGAALWRSRRARERSGPLVVAVALTMGGTLAVFGTIAFARGARGWPSGLETHYATLGIPLWGMIGVGLFACGRRTLPALICAVATAAFVTDLPTGPSPPYVAVGESFHRDWCAGVSTRALTDRYMQLLFYVDTAETRSIVFDKLDVIRRKPFPAWRCDQRR